MIEIRPATRAEINSQVSKLFAHLVEEAYIGVEIKDGRCFGMVSFAHDPDDPMTGSFLARSHSRRWAFMDLRGGAEKYGFRIVRAARRYLREVGEVTHVTCGGAPKAHKLLRSIGFEPTNEMWRGARVWVWRPE